jgi:hypothetical protein
MMPAEGIELRFIDVPVGHDDRLNKSNVLEIFIAGPSINAFSHW